jgi:hypothetical protein
MEKPHNETTGDLRVSEQPDTAAFTGLVLVQGDLTAQEAPDTAAAAGTVTD